MARRQADSEFGKQVKAERERLKWTQVEMAKLMTANGFHLGSTDVAKIEAGTRVVRIDEALAISDVLGVPLESLLGRMSGNLRHDRHYRLQMLVIGADRSARQVRDAAATLAQGRHDMAKFDFEGRASLEADGKRAWDALSEAYTALRAIATYMPSSPEAGSMHPADSLEAEVSE